MKQRFCFFILTLLSFYSSAQQQHSETWLPDSLETAATRSFMNSIPVTDYLKRTFLQDSFLLNYRLLKPVKTKRNRKYPLVITLHNSTRIGSDNEKQLEPLSRLWLRKDIRQKYPAYVIAPQFKTRSSNYEKDSARTILISKPSGDVVALLQLIHQLQTEFTDIDPRRIYIVGYSMGGSTGQNLLSMAPGIFAALVSIAAVPDFSNIKEMNSVPVWLIHGEKDIDNPYAGSVELFKELSNNRHAVFTTYTKADHNTISIPLLLSDKIPAWLFRQHH